MTPAEAAALLAVAAAFDNRKPDADAATAWALALDGARFEDCRDSIVAYYREHREWIMPSDVLAGARLVRRRRLEDFYHLLGRNYLLPPPHLADDPRGEQQWADRMTKRIRDGEITRPDQLDYEYDPNELVQHDVVAELGQIGREVPRA